VALTAFVRVRVTSVEGRAVRWAQGQSFTFTRAFLDRTGWTDRVSASGTLALADDAGVTIADAVEARERAAFTETPPVSATLPFSYQRVPGWGRAAIASIVGRWRRGRETEWAQFPGFPLDLTADLLTDLASPPDGRLDAEPTPVLLTHDIDSAEGLARLRSDFLAIEEAVGARSASYVVPCGWTLDQAALEDVAARGHELGVHGYDHANRTPFADADERRRRLDAAQPFVERYRAVGYRAPSLLRTRALLRDLASRFQYDSSVPTSGGLFPVPNNGCASARPFTLEGVRELPLSMPRDGSLRFLGYSADAIAAMWRECADAVHRSRGVVVLLTHCEQRFSGNPGMLGAYRGFLEHLAGSTAFRFTTPRALMMAS
jgi:peptidoglycan/xylan/chitin deacetylase (PgdA/CDA1 family)